MSEFSISIRTVVCFALFPILPGLLMAIPDFFRGNLGMVMWYVRFSATLAYPITIIVFIPIYIVMRYFGINGIQGYFTLGLAIGFLSYLFVFIPGLYRGDIDAINAMRSNMIFLVITIPLSVLVTIFFWIIVRPDRLETLL